MGNGYDYKPNPYLIALLIIGTFAIVAEIVLYMFHDLRIFYIDLLLIIDIFLSAQLVYIDARKIDAGKAYPEQKTFRAMTWTPASWGVLVLVFWIILFPKYLSKRQEIYWQNISVDYQTLKTIEREIEPQMRKQAPRPKPKNKDYSENVGICPHCDTPYPLKMLERSKYCNRCGGLLK
jgi:hypothetical protein